MQNKKIIFDAHCDTIQILTDNMGTLNDTSYSVNIPDASNKLPYIQCFAAFVHPKYAPDRGYERACSILDKFYEEYDKNKNKITLIKELKDLQKVIQNNLFGTILTVENGSAIGGNLDNVQKLYNRGVRIMGITWNNDNDLAAGAKTENDFGLTELGKKYIKELNKRNILIDVSHASEKTFYDISEITNSPILATHSCAKSLCNHQRNLTDDQIKKIAETHGVIGINFYDQFLKDGGTATIDDVINHMIYISNLVGTKYVGIGTDFEGIDQNELPKGITGIRDIQNLFARMRERGFSEEEITQISGKNFVECIEKTLEKNRIDLER